MRENLEIILIIEVNIYTLNTITSFKIKVYTNECKYIQCSRKCLYCKKRAIDPVYSLGKFKESTRITATL